MLKKLSVTNFAIIEDISVEFENGMIAITGETGAGKSLLIDSINLLLGARADSDMIRYGATSATVIGEFTYNNALDDIFSKEGIKDKTKVVVERTISNSKNIIKLNGIQITLLTLKSISKYLALIHNQNDTYKLFNPDNYLELLDPVDDKKFETLKNKYTKALYNYSNALKRYEEILKGQKNSLEKLDYLKYEFEELSNLNLYENIDVELEEEVSKLENFDNIMTSLNTVYEALDNERFSTVDNLYEAMKSIEKISDFSADYNSYKDVLSDAYYNLLELKNNISSEISSFEYDPDEFNLKQEKLNDINKAKEKYKMSVNELISYIKKIELEIGMATNYDEVLAESKKETANKYNLLKDASIELSEYRKKIALKLEKAIISECHDLDLENTEFSVTFNDVLYDNPFSKAIFKDNGVDEIDFLISFNKGEPSRPLAKVASGGEASRIMLALMSYFSKTTLASTIIFDEIDTGVSGKTSGKIANKMHEISKSLQVMAITHQPQVAARGDYQKKIIKVLANGRSHTEVLNLNNDDRVMEIASMISGETLSVSSIEMAKELLNNMSE